MPPQGDPRANAADELAVLRDAARPRGFLHEMGDEYRALYRQGGDILLVHFETMSKLRARRSGLPWSTGLHRARNWSTLTVLSEGRTWWRDPELYAFFDGLTDTGFFDRFESVVFAGGGRSGYAAAAYSVAAPGSTLVLMKPYATLDRDVAPWETRFRRDWSLDFTSRYGNAARLSEAARHVYLVTDPAEMADAMHASLFAGEHVTHLRAHHAGTEIWARLTDMDLIDRIIVLAEGGRLTRERFAQLWRARRADPGWRKAMTRKIERIDRPAFSKRMMRWLRENAPESVPTPRRRSRALSRLLEIEHSDPMRAIPHRPRLAGE